MNRSAVPLDPRQPVARETFTTDSQPAARTLTVRVSPSFPVRLLKIGLPMAFLLVSLPALEGGRTLRIRGLDYSFLVTEPSGWTIDVGSAIQVANFVMHPEGTHWRKADVVAFSRFFPRNPDEDLENFLQSELAGQEVLCPNLEISDLHLDLELDPETRKRPRVVAKSCACPGGKQEVVAFTEVTDYFVIFVLSARDEATVSRALPTFQQLISSFRWLGPPRSAVELHRSDP